MQNRFEIYTPNGWSKFSGIRKTTKNSYVEIKTENRKALKCSKNHPVKTPSGFVYAEKLLQNDLVITDVGISKIVSIRDVSQKEYFYDALDVELDNEYYTNGIASHNCEFLGSSGTLISGAVLKTLFDEEPIDIKAGVSLFEPPQKEHSYVMIGDTSRGKGLDYSAFSVIDITKMPYRQVCTFRDNMTTPTEYAEVIFRVAKAFNDAYVMLELNDLGGQVADLLHDDYEYEMLLYTENAGRAGRRIAASSMKADRGVITTKTVKAVGCSTLKLLIEQQQLRVIDKHAIDELKTFSKKGNSYEAEAGKHDDMVMGLVLFAWLTTQPFFRELNDINTMSLLRDRSQEELENEMMPLGLTWENLNDMTETIVDKKKYPHWGNDIDTDKEVDDMWVNMEVFDVDPHGDFYSMPYQETKSGPHWADW